MALYSNKFNRSNFRGRGRGRSFQTSSPQPAANSSSPTCQICHKIGHLASNCWHRTNLQISPPTTTRKALYTAPTASSDWILDTRASSHLTSDLSNIHQPAPYNGADRVQIGDGSTVPITHSGSGILPTPTRKLHLSTLLHSPHLSHNLLSFRQLTADNNCYLCFTADGYQIKDRTSHCILASGPSVQGIYPIPPRLALHSTLCNASTWHRRLGHPHLEVFQQLLHHLPCSAHSISTLFCNSCQASKSHRLSFPSSVTKALQPFTIVHTDVWGPAPLKSHEGYLYYVLFVDEFTRFTWLYPMYHKSDVFPLFTQFHQLVLNQFNCNIKTLRSDGGGEYISSALRSYLAAHGIQQQLSCPYTPEQNGIAERKHHHLLETARTLLLDANLPNSF